MNIIKMIKKVLKIFCANSIMALGIILRVIFGLSASPNAFQHDVLIEGGHFHYACHIFSTMSLPNTRYAEFYQPPLNAILRAAYMKFASLFIRPTKSLSSLFIKYIGGDYNLLFENPSLSKYMLKLFATTKILSILYSIVTLIFIYKILNLFDINKKIKNFVLLVISFYPGLVILSMTYANDGLAFMFYFMSIYFALSYYKTQKFVTIIKLALSIGFGMLSKTSVGMVAFVVSPILLLCLIRSFRANACKVNFSECDSANHYDHTTYNNSRLVIFQYIIFALIVFPLGLSYLVREKILFDQAFTYVRKITEGAQGFTGDISILKRLSIFPFDRILSENNGPFHDLYEYNIWIDLIKTSLFDEYNTRNAFLNILAYVLVIINAAFYLLSFVAFAFCITKLCRGYFPFRFGGKSAFCIKHIDSSHVFARDSHMDDSSNFSCDILIIAAVLMYLVAIVSYLFFNMNYPASCSSNYRYIPYITFAQAILVSQLIMPNEQK